MTTTRRLRRLRWSSSGRALAARAGPVLVVHHRGRHVPVAPAPPRAAPAEVGVLGVHEQPLVEAAHVVEVAAAEEHGRAAPAPHVLLAVVLAGVHLAVAAVVELPGRPEHVADVVDPRRPVDRVGEEDLGRRGAEALRRRRGRRRADAASPARRRRRSSPARRRRRRRGRPGRGSRRRRSRGWRRSG